MRLKLKMGGRRALIASERGEEDGDASFVGRHCISGWLCCLSKKCTHTDQLGRQHPCNDETRHCKSSRKSFFHSVIV